MIDRFLKEYEIAKNRILLDKKTPVQTKIEIILTGGRGYEEVPYIKFLGDKIALKTWLKFARTRFICNYNYEEQASSLERNIAPLFVYISHMQKMSEKNFN